MNMTMKIAVIALFTSYVSSADAVGFRDLVGRVTQKQPDSAGVAVVPPSEGETEGATSAAADGEGRKLNNCWGGNTPAPAWHPVYSAGWTNGYCRNTVDCNSPSYSSELACCKGAYAGQASGHCLSRLPEPPTTAPTDTGGLDVFYPDYNTAWPDAGCINTRPMPSGRPTYTTMLACCKGAYGGQMSGKCLSMLPEPPTTAPTTSDYEADFWYPDYDTAWSEAGCKNTLPLPYNNINDRPNYPSQLECCKGAYGGQVSGICLSQLPEAPTQAPTSEGGLDFFYPDYSTAWSEATCINTRPLPSGRPTYPSILECCKGAYGGQVSGKCLASLPEPPTLAPTGSGGLDVYYPDYDKAWNIAGCINTRPLPSGRPTYSSQLDCCKGAYGGQVSGACLAGLPDAPTASPTGVGGLDVYYPDYSKAWPEGVCINDSPLPSGRPTFSTRAQCCNSSYGGQTSDKCQCDINPCFSCKCSGAATNPACSLTCS